MTNADFAQTDRAFKEACFLAGTEPNRRQASKYRRSMGAAWRARAAFMSRYLTTKRRLEEEVKRASMHVIDMRDVLTLVKAALDAGEVGEEAHEAALKDVEQAEVAFSRAKLELARHEQIRDLLKGIEA